MLKLVPFFLGNFYASRANDIDSASLVSARLQ